MVGFSLEAQGTGRTSLRMGHVCRGLKEEEKKAKGRRGLSGEREHWM